TAHLRLWRKFFTLIKFNFNKLNFLKIIILILSVNLLGLSKTDLNKFKTFAPDENSVQFNEAYTQNFFFGNFGIKHLINAVPINEKSVKTLKISADTETKKNQIMMDFSYDEQEKLIQMKISEFLSGEAMTVDYAYQDNLISEEIFTTSDGQKSNKFYCTNGKMNVVTSTEMFDNYSLRGLILYKTSYLDGKLVFKD